MGTSRQAQPPQHKREGSRAVRTKLLPSPDLPSFLIGETGVILGFIALNQIKTTGERGRWLAVAAVVVGCAYTAIFAYLTVAVFSSEGPGG